MRKGKARVPVVVASFCVAAALGIACAVARLPASPGAPTLDNELLGAADGLIKEAPDTGEADEYAKKILDSSEHSQREDTSAVAERAAEVLEGYERTQECALMRSGYLDLSGNRWGCVAFGGDWAEICVVSEANEGEGSETNVWRIDAEDAGFLEGS